MKVFIISRNKLKKRLEPGLGQDEGTDQDRQCQTVEGESRRYSSNSEIASN